jgi:hypothetical protein
VLYRGMYTSSVIGESSDRFGLKGGQFYALNFVADVMWYNQKGELLGRGDITYSNVIRISSELFEGEIFFLLREHALAPLDYIDVISPGIDVVCQKASYAISPGVVYAIDQKGVYGRGQKVHYKDIEVEMISPESLRRLIG